MTWNRYSGKSCFLSIVAALLSVFFALRISHSHSQVNRFHNTRLHLHFSIILFVVIQQEVQRSENLECACERICASSVFFFHAQAQMHRIHPLIYFPLKPHLKFRVQRFSTLKCIFDARKWDRENEQSKWKKVWEQ